INGWNLTKLARPLRDAGVTALNVSVDSLDPERFLRATGKPGLAEVLEGIDAALAAGFETVKVNTVLMRGLNDKDFEAFYQWTRRQPISVRFIELMRTGDNRALFEQCHLPSGELLQSLEQAGWARAPRSDGDGPALELTHPGHQGRLGLIAPYSPGFCLSCNRLRVSSQGGLRLCLFGEQDHSLRPWVQSPAHREALTDVIRRLLVRKPASHHLHEGKHGSTSSLAAIGG
ncbi:MAG: radical SAM protein, partial [Myxococcaceae bacterium]